jgi:butyryl-CoA dehydrogenase
MARVSSIPESVLQQLSSLAEKADRLPAWPEESLSLLADTDAWRWSIPVAFGGADYDSPALLAAYEDIAGCCLTTAFILSQRDAAIRRIVAFAPAAMQSEVLPRLAAGEIFTTIGLSQLTTSRQHGKPALQVSPSGGGRFRLHGEIPWVTGADRAGFVVIGAKDDEGKQYLFALPTEQPGVKIESLLPLMALAGSRTSRIILDDVELGLEGRLIGPVNEIPVLRRGGTGGLETSCLALGLAGSAIGYLQEEGTKRSELRPISTNLRAELDALRERMLAIARRELSPHQAAGLRSEATQLALTAAQVALISAKGAGYVRGHPVERWARQALFFLVWSCPQAVQHQMMDAQLSLVCAPPSEM